MNIAGNFLGMKINAETKNLFFCVLPALLKGTQKMVKTTLQNNKCTFKYRVPIKDIPRVHKSFEKPLQGRERLKTVLATLAFLLMAAACFTLAFMMSKMK
jgi:hypothetical protein